MNKNLIKRTIICGNRTPRLQFRNNFVKEIEQFTKAILNAYKLYEKLNHKKDSQKAWAKLYLYAAMQNVVSAFNIFISGYVVAPGNLMRHFHESISIAILFSSKKLNYYTNFKKDYKNFSYQKAPAWVQSKLQYFDIEPKAWRQFIKIMKFYHKFSHSTALAVSSNAVMHDEKLMVLGSYFDKGKINEYKKQIAMMVSAAELLSNIIQGIEQEFKNTT